MPTYQLLSRASCDLLLPYRLQARETILPNLSGGQLMRRKGQSLDFREYLPYQPGDDVRFVDWRASARYGGPTDWVVRSFVAEEHLRLVVSVDARPTMELPRELPKLQLARWLAEALARVAIASGDQVWLHRLFDRYDSAPLPITSESQLRDALESLVAQPNVQPPINLGMLRPALPPAIVWLIVTDLYFDDDSDARALATMIDEAIAGRCWVLLVDLDSWPFEQAALDTGRWRIEGPGAPANNLLDLDRDSIKSVDEHIHKHKKKFLDGTHLDQPDYVHWLWPASGDAERFFQEQFLAEKRIQDIFVKQTL
jgi:hypothetical protein